MCWGEGVRRGVSEGEMQTVVYSSSAGGVILDIYPALFVCVLSTRLLD